MHGSSGKINNMWTSWDRLTYSELRVETFIVPFLPFSLFLFRTLLSSFLVLCPRQSQLSLSQLVSHSISPQSVSQSVRESV